MRIENKMVVWPIHPHGLGQILHVGILKDFHWGTPGPVRVLNHFSLVYVIDGDCNYYDENRPSLIQRKVTSGGMFLLFPGLPHCYGPPPPLPGAPWSQIFISFAGPIFDLWRERGLLDPSNRFFTLKPLGYWIHRIETVMQAFPTDNGADPQGLGALQGLLGEILSRSAKSDTSEDDASWLRQARSALEGATRADSLDVYAVADLMNTSYANFRKKFTRLSGVSPGRYHATCLMRRACQIMHERKITDRELAEHVGYSDAFRFAQRFRQIIGVSPRQFRRSLPSPAITPDPSRVL